jgi:hypothetical protein
MKTKKQHFVGALLGAVVGIMLAGVFESQWMLLASFPCALIGYLSADERVKKFFRDILTGLLRSLRSICGISRGIFQNFSALSEQMSEKLADAKKSILKKCSRTARVFSRVVRLPKKFNIDLRGNVIDQAKASTLMAMLVMASLGFCVALALGKYLIVKEIIDVKHSAASANFSWILISFMIWMLTSLVPILAFLDMKNIDLARRYRVRIDIQRNGLSGWIISDFKLMLKVGLAYAYICVAGIAYAVLVGGSIVVFLFLPAIAFIFALHAIYCISVKHEVWTCAIVTTIATAITGLVFWDQVISDFTFRWLISLATGTAAGFISWQTSRLVEKFSKHEFLERLLSAEVDAFSGTWLITQSLASCYPRGMERILVPVRNIM